MLNIQEIFPNIFPLLHISRLQFPHFHPWRHPVKAVPGAPTSGQAAGLFPKRGFSCSPGISRGIGPHTARIRRGLFSEFSCGRHSREKEFSLFQRRRFPGGFSAHFLNTQPPGPASGLFRSRVFRRPESLGARRHSTGQVSAFRHSVCLRGNGSLTVGDSREGFSCQNDSFGTWSLLTRGNGTARKS